MAAAPWAPRAGGIPSTGWQRGSSGSGTGRAWHAAAPSCEPHRGSRWGGRAPVGMGKIVPNQHEKLGAGSPASKSPAKNGRSHQAGATGGGELFLAPARTLGSRRDRAASRLERRRGAIFSSERVFANEACEQHRCWGAPPVPGTPAPTAPHGGTRVAPAVPRELGLPSGLLGSSAGPRGAFCYTSFSPLPAPQTASVLRGILFLVSMPGLELRKMRPAAPVLPGAHLRRVFPTEEPCFVGFLPPAPSSLHLVPAPWAQGLREPRDHRSALDASREPWPPRDACSPAAVRRSCC